MSKILEKIIEPSKIMVSSSFLLKIKVDLGQKYNLLTEAGEDIILENGENLIMEGDFYE